MVIKSSAFSPGALSILKEGLVFLIQTDKRLPYLIANKVTLLVIIQIMLIIQNVSFFLNLFI